MIAAACGQPGESTVVAPATTTAAVSADVVTADAVSPGTSTTESVTAPTAIAPATSEPVVSPARTSARTSPEPTRIGATRPTDIPTSEPQASDDSSPVRSAPTASVSDQSTPTVGPAATKTPEPTEMRSPTAIPGPTTSATAPSTSPTGTVAPSATATSAEAGLPVLTPQPTVSPALALGSPTSADPGDSDPLTEAVQARTEEVRAVRTKTGVLGAVVDGGPFEWTMITPCFGTSLVAGPEIIEGPIDVLIDPGHGGDETGAVASSGLRESHVNLVVAQALEQRLVARGYRVLLTRDADHRVAIQSRAALALALQPAVFVSVHHNGGFPELHGEVGTEVFVQQGSEQSQRLGGLIFDELTAAFADIDVDWVANRTRGVSWRSNVEGTDLYGVLRRTRGVPSVLTEAMFLTNPPEAALLADPAVLAAEADALARAIDRYFSSADNGSGFIEGLIFRGDLGPGGGTDGCKDPALR